MRGHQASQGQFSKPAASSVLSPLAGAIDMPEDNFVFLQWWEEALVKKWVNIDVEWNLLSVST